MTVEFEPFSLRLSEPLGTAAGVIDTRRGFLVRVTVAGEPGLGEATPLPGWTESIDACEDALERVEDPIAAVQDGHLLDTPAARHGVSLAVLDAQSRAADRPLYRFLGGAERVGSVPVNATVGDGTPEETAAAAERAVLEGYPAVKLKVGARPSDEDLDRLRAVRSACPDVEIRLDANGAYDETTADRLLPTFAGLGVSILEQPLPAASLEAHGRLRGRGVDIALDEGLVEHGSEAALGAGVADYLVCKPMALGGIDVARNVVRSARTAGIDAFVTTTIDGAVARAAAVHLGASIPDVVSCGLATGGLLESDLRSGVAPVADGAATVPQGKGNIPPR